MTATAWKEHLFFVFVCFLPLLSCHLFSMKFFRQLIPSNRTSNITFAKTTAGSILSCNLKCINNKPCISTLFFKGQKKCVLLKSFFNGMKENPETPKNDNATKVVESPSRFPCSLSPCSPEENCSTDEETGKICKCAGYSCMALKQKNKNLQSGYYNICINSSTEEKIRVYCDMFTDGGGWTRILRVVSDTDSITEFLKKPFWRWKQLTGFTPQGNYMIEPTALRNSLLVDNETQIRFKCHLPSTSKSIHLMTTKDAKGKAVLNLLLGKTLTRPVACNSFKPLPGDSSYLASHCSAWAAGDGKWGRPPSVPVDSLFITYPMYADGRAHWGIFQMSKNAPNRFECDNYRWNKILKGETWEIFVR